MKPKVLIVGEYIEGTESGVEMKGWSIDGSKADESLSLDELKQLAASAGTFTQKEGAIFDDGARGVRWYGDSPFGD
jgi:hypothetical protein